MIFKNREEAGELLGESLLANLQARENVRDVVVLGLPRGGVETAAAVARVIHAPLGILMVRKLRHPKSPEFAIGAIAEDDKPIYSEKDILNIDPAWLKLEEEGARELIERRRELYYDSTIKPPEIQHHTVVLVDDGIATGLTMLAALKHALKRGADQIIVAAPVASGDAVKRLASTGASLVLLDDPQKFYGSVGMHYKKFNQVSDLDVHTIIADFACSGRY